MWKDNDMSAESAETNERFVEITRTEQTVYRATNKDGDSVTFGQKPGMFSPVELLLAGLAGCTSVSVDIVSSRRAEPTVFNHNIESPLYCSGTV